VAKRIERIRRTLTAEYVRSALDYDPETGIFRWRVRTDMLQRWNTRYAGKVAGFKGSGGYIMIQIGKDTPGWTAARLAWLHMTGEWPPDQVDHINMIRDDNRWVNLRAVTNSENNQNRGPQSNNIIGERGISVHKTGRYRVRLMANGVQHDLGYFDTLEAAMAARKDLEAQHHAGFARS
jgi:hypothetical protein